MAMREKFGRLVLLEQEEQGPLGLEYRAARLGPAGLERLVSVLRFGPVVSSSAEATKVLTNEARLAARMQSPGLVRVLGVGRAEQSFYVSTELVEGKSLAAILEHCRSESFPFAADHALMIASRAAVALEPLHARKSDAGEALAHGLLAPSRLVVAYDGDVKVKGLGLWPALRATGLLPPAEGRYLAPEQAAGHAGDPRSDVYALGLVLLEALTGFVPDGTDPASRLDGAQVTDTAGERGPLPPPLADLLRRSLVRDPAGRFGDAAAFRKAIAALLFSGDFAPTTFDLAFFMHTLFREEMEREAKALEDARHASYGEFLAEAKPASASPGALPAPVAAPPPPASPRTVPDRPAPSPEPEPEASGSRPGGTRLARESAAREAAARMTLGAPPAEPARRPLLWPLLGLLAVVVAGGGAGWLYSAKRRGPAPPTPTTLSASAAAAQERVRELEARIAQLEREKDEAEARAAEEARQAVEARAAAGGGRADPAAVAQAEEVARGQARAEQERRQRDERRRLDDEKKAEERRIAEASPSPDPLPPPSATPVPEPTPEPTPTAEPPAPPPVAVSPTSPGALVELTDPALVPPAAIGALKPRYPPMALQRRIDGTVELQALVDETGRVAEVRVVSVSRRGLGFEEQAVRAAKARGYRPGTKDGVPVRVWVPIVVNFQISVR